MSMTDVLLVLILMFGVGQCIHPGQAVPHTEAERVFQLCQAVEAEHGYVTDPRCRQL